VIREYIKNNARELTGMVSLAVILAFLCGLLTWATHIVHNRYVHYGLFNLILFELPDYMNFYFLVSLFIFLVLASIYILMRAIVRRNSAHIAKTESGGEKIIYSFILSVAVIMLLSYFSFLFYRDIIGFLKGNPLTAQLGKLSYAPKETFYIFIFASAVSGLIFTFCLTYLVSRTGIPGLFQRYFRRIIASKGIRPIGVGVIAMLLVPNIFIPLYWKYNKPRGPNVILVLIDTLRADHLGVYGYARNTSPNIDKFASEGILFENAFSQASWTYPSVASIQTSLYPSQIGEFYSKFILNDSLLTLTEYMKNNFYETIAVISNVYVSKGFGFSQGFDIFDQDSVLKPDSITSHLVTDKAIKYLREYGDEPFFLWVHYMDPHSIYIHHPEYGYRKENSSNIDVPLTGDRLKEITKSLNPDDIQYVIDTYDEEVSYTDQNFGRLIDAIKELELDKNTVIILSADHGEEFLERRRFGHAASLYNEIIHVPLIIYSPFENGRKGTIVGQNVEVRNIARTIIETCGLPNDNFGGMNLYGTQANNGEKELIFSQQSEAAESKTPERTVIMGKWKLIEKTKEGTFELYDLESDYREKENLFGSDKIEDVRRRLLSALSSFNPDVVAHSESAQHNYEEIRKIKALGYIE
jgi:arylsulfatase A-like enzyme